MNPPYKNSTNSWLTQALFWEKMILRPSSERHHPVVFSLYDDKSGLVNARRTFVDLGDPTGYKWAMQYLGDYEHWKALCKCKWFQEALEVWMHELRMKIQSEALDVIRETAKGESNPAQALAAAKYLAGFEWDKASRGRPSKSELTGELKRQAKLLEAEDDDFERIGLKLVTST